MGNDIAAFIESNLTIVQGPRAGEPFKSAALAAAFLARRVQGRCVERRPQHGARQWQKSTFMAAIAYCAVAPDGPLFEPMSETVIVAASFDQGKVIFDHLVMFMKQHTEADKSRYKVRDSNNLIVEDKQTKTRVRVLSQNPRTMHGIQAKLLLLDELAQWEHTKIEQSLAALQTSLGKIEGSRILAIGTSDQRPATTRLKRCSPVAARTSL